MCNSYRVKPKRSELRFEKAVSGEIEKLPSGLVRRTGRGVVVTMDGGEMQPATMRWGFHRPFSDAINNARSDKFHSPVWKDAYAIRRCIVPISTFYEWQPLPHKGKQPFEFRRPDGEWMWVAGLFEDSEKYGPCYATITTEPPDWVKPIHDRLLAILDFEHGMHFLHGGALPFTPYSGELIATPCASPLKHNPGSQSELF